MEKFRVYLELKDYHSIGVQIKQLVIEARKMKNFALKSTMDSDSDLEYSDREALDFTSV
jgi:hypothetical protein